MYLMQQIDFVAVCLQNDTSRRFPAQPAITDGQEKREADRQEHRTQSLHHQIQ